MAVHATHHDHIALTSTEGLLCVVFPPQAYAEAFEAGFALQRCVARRRLDVLHRGDAPPPRVYLQLRTQLALTAQHDDGLSALVREVASRHVEGLFGSPRRLLEALAHRALQSATTQVSQVGTSQMGARQWSAPRCALGRGAPSAVAKQDPHSLSLAHTQWKLTHS